MPILATPAFALFGYIGLLGFNVAMLVLGLWGGFRLARRWVPEPVAAATVLAMATLPIFTRNAYAYSNDVMYAAMVAWGYERWFCGKMASAGLLLGLSIWAKATNGILGLPLGVALLVGRRWRDAAWMAGATALPVGAFLVQNAVMFGSPLTTAYHRVLVMTGGVQTISNVADSFGRDLQAGTAALWADHHEGLRRNALLLMPAMLGLVPLWRRSRTLTLALAFGLVCYAALYIPYEYTYARFFLPWALLLLTPLALLVELGTTVATRATWLWAPARRRWSVPVLALVACGMSLGLLMSRAPSPQWTAADHIAQAKVVRGEGAQAIPCDYYNLRHLKWECAIREPEVWQRWGLAVGDECRFSRLSAPATPTNAGPDLGDDWLWVHPNAHTAKSIAFTAPPGDVLVRYGLGDRSKFRSATLVVSSDSGAIETMQTHDIGTIHAVHIPAGKRGSTIRIDVPAQTHDWRHLCVAVRVLP